MDYRITQQEEDLRYVKAFHLTLTSLRTHTDYSQDVEVLLLLRSSWTTVTMPVYSVSDILRIPSMYLVTTV